MGVQTKQQFDSWVHRFGIISSAILFLAMTCLPVAVSLVFGSWPSITKLWPGFVLAFLAMMPFWPAETIGYMPIMGPGALYLSYITGNVTNLRMPSTLNTINALGLKPNTDECHTMAIIACGASVLTTVGILLFGLFLAAPLQPILKSPALQPAFTYVVPAIFGGLVAQTILDSKKHFVLYLFPLAICLFFCFFTKLPAAFYMLIAVACSAMLFVVDYKGEITLRRNRPNRRGAV